MSWLARLAKFEMAYYQVKDVASIDGKKSKKMCYKLLPPYTHASLCTHMHLHTCEHTDTHANINIT